MKMLIVKFPNDAEYEQLKIDAHQHNCNLSEYIRYLVAKERKMMGNEILLVYICRRIFGLRKRFFQTRIKS